MKIFFTLLLKQFKLIVFLILFISSYPLLAQIPNTISYQGVLKDANGIALTGKHNLLFKLYQAETGGSSIWEENHIGIDIKSGLFNVILGEKTILSNLLFDKQYWLGITVDGGTELTRLKLTSIPYSLIAKTVPDKSITLGKINTTGASTNQVLTFDGTNLIWKTVSTSQGGITQLNPGSGITLNPNPITSTGTISLQNPFNGNFSVTNSYSISTGTPSTQIDNGDIVADDDLLADDDVTAGNDLYVGNFAHINDIIYLNKYDDNVGGIYLYNGNKVLYQMGFTGGTNQLAGGVVTTFSGLQRTFVGTYSASGGGAGLIELYDHFGQRSVRIDGETGMIAGRTKSFIVIYPLDDTKDIVYTSLEGPEAAAYFRGTTNLKNGNAFIEYPEHFRLLINSKTITVNLTPLSAESKGLAVINKTDSGLEVKELFQGNGNYEFDYEVKGVRKGYEDYKVIRDKIKPTSVALPIEEKIKTEDE